MWRKSRNYKSSITPNYIKSAVERKGSFFFTRRTMRFFGDTMRSFDCAYIDGETYLFRKPSAYVNVFGTWKLAGETHFNIWRYDFDTSDLITVPSEKQTQLFNLLYS